MHARKLKDLPKLFRPREKLKAKGVDALSNVELLALLLGSGIKGMPVLSLAKAMVRYIQDKDHNSLTLKELSCKKGVGEAKACAVLAALELGHRFIRDGKKSIPVVGEPESVYLLTSDLALLRKEHFVVLYLNAKNHLLKRETISIGTLSSTLVHPREVFVPAVEASAASIVLVHNHPSGDPEPSPEDQLLTRRLIEAGDLLGIDVLDHLILGKNGYVSLRERKFFAE